MEERETIKIKTLKDVIDKVPTEKLDYFLLDLKNWVLLHKNIELAKKDKIINKELDIETSETMDWIDDDDNKQNIKVVLSEKGKIN